LADHNSFLAVGDVHGSARQLEALLRVEGIHHQRRVVFLGDFVDVGSDSRGVVDLLLDFRAAYSHTIFLKGNHDMALVEYLRVGDFAAYAAVGGIATIRSYCGEVYGAVHSRLVAAMPDNHKRFLTNLDTYFESADALFSHSGYNPDRPDDRSVDAMVLASHQKLFEASPLDKLAVCGHYFQVGLRPFVSDRFICLDTGCAILNGPLTAMQLPERQVVQVHADLRVSWG
jgi:serine/threonine protein phosphatase 1